MELEANAVSNRISNQQPRGLMDKSEVTSDKIIVKLDGIVRTWGYFGQNKRKVPLKCPNLMLLRTKQEGRAAEMSEPGATSDKTRRKSR
jgi:hypothetical protein